MIVSAIEASNKELKGNKGARETMPRENIKTRETLQAIVEEFFFLKKKKTIAKMKNSEV